MSSNEPLKNVDDWEDFVEAIYAPDSNKEKDEYRNYDDPQRDCVREFYRLNHQHQTYEFATEKQRYYTRFEQRKMTVLEAFDFLNTLVDDSDPDIELCQRDHLLQTAEAIRADGHPDWFVLTGLIHDVGKILCLFGEPQWTVVGDTFPVGCQFSEAIVYPEFFEANSDARNSRFNTRLGVYDEGCGLRNIQMSWGHDEYMYQVVKDKLPEPALYMIRFHSFYAWHHEHAYEYLTDDHDREMLKWVLQFNQYDLYSKSPNPPVWEELEPYYRELIEKYLPGTLCW